MNFRSDFRSGCFARANGPDRLVRKQNTREVSRGQRMEAALKLALQDRFGVIGFTFRQAFAYADDRRQVRGQRGFYRRFTEASDSAKYWRRSEWPMITARLPVSATMAIEISPV